MTKLKVTQAYTTTDGTTFTGADAAQKASEHQAMLDNKAVIESYIVANGLIKSAAGAARNMLPKFLAYKAAIESGELELQKPATPEAGEGNGEAGADTKPGAEGGEGGEGGTSNE